MLSGCAAFNAPLIKEIGLTGVLPANVPANAQTAVAFAQELERAWNYPGARLTSGHGRADDISRVEFPRARIPARLYIVHAERTLTVQIWGDIQSPRAAEMAEIATKIALEKYGVVLRRFQRRSFLARVGQLNSA